MFSAKKSILQTAALLKSYQVKHIIVSPGSRNAPLMQTFSQEPFFECHVVVDERNAAFYALGIIQALRQPVAICCTSGSALLNYAPAVSEAYYQQLPLIVISADRSPEWIGQMDGQTLPQEGAFGSMVKKTVNLPEVKNDTDEWYCNRLINEALMACTQKANGPVQINIPLAEPLFDYSEQALPDARRIYATATTTSVDIKQFASKWEQLSKRLIIVGQSFYSPQLCSVLEKLAKDHNCVILTEHLSNCQSSSFISNFDAVLYSIEDAEKSNYSPDLLITIGGHIVSKRVKHFLRQYKPKEHWLLTKSGEVADLFQSLTDLVETDEISFLTGLLENVSTESGNTFPKLWKDESNKVAKPAASTQFSDIEATRMFLSAMPENSILHLANSSAVRNAQLFSLPDATNVYCNRGVNGIESTLPTTVGFAAVHKEEPVYLIIGDLSFFYGLNALWNISHIKNLRILLINNNGGGIFHVLPGLNKSASLNEFVAAEHHTNAKAWTEASGIKYLSASDTDEMKVQLAEFTNKKMEQSILLEVRVDMAICKRTLQEYYHNLKNK